MLAASILCEEVGSLILGAVEAEATEHWGFAHIYVAVDGKVGDVCVLTESEVLQLDLAVGAVYFDSEVFTSLYGNALVVKNYPVFIAISLDGNFDTTVASSGCLVKGNLGDACERRGDCAWFCG